jgi:hypothetical protein
MQEITVRLNVEEEAISFAFLKIALTIGELRSFLNTVFFASLRDACRRKPVSWFITPFFKLELSLSITSFLLSMSLSGLMKRTFTVSVRLILCGPKNQGFSFLSNSEGIDTFFKW